MMKNYEQLEDLLLHKDFDALSTQEQIGVLSLMSKEEYQTERHILVESKALLTKKPILPASNIAALQQQFKAKHRASPFQQSIALYQALLLSMVVGLIVWYLRPTEIEVQTKTEVLYQTKTDTVFQEKIITKDRIVYKTKMVEIPVQQTDTIYVPFANRAEFYQEKEQQKEVLFAKGAGKGKSLKEMNGLMNFLTN